jgi:hypothetical protein
MSLTIELPPAVEEKLREEATREHQSPEEFVRTLLERRFPMPDGTGSGLAALMDTWLAEPPDLEEAEGYPEHIEPLQLREGFVV